MERLEEIVSAMEGDRTPLEEMLVGYEEGMNLLHLCRQRIDSARKRVELITLQAERKASLTPFDPGENTPEAPEEKPKLATSPSRRRKADAEETNDDDIRLF